ncbi:MAG TPA: mobilization protein [Panacibacter sp.]|nr:mobilization protein [Panacibacter sp.]
MYHYRIESKAKAAGFTVAEYLRGMGLTGKIDRRIKVIPREILEYKATLNHMAANLNQAAKKANSNEPLTGMERQGLFNLEEQVKTHIKNIEKYFQ